MKLLRAYDLTIEEAAAMSDRELLRLPMFGKTSLWELRVAMASAAP